MNNCTCGHHYGSQKNKSDPYLTPNVVTSGTSDNKEQISLLSNNIMSVLGQGVQQPHHSLDSSFVQISSSSHVKQQQQQEQAIWQKQQNDDNNFTRPIISDSDKELVASGNSAGKDRIPFHLESTNEYQSCMYFLGKNHCLNGLEPTFQNYCYEKPTSFSIESVTRYVDLLVCFAAYI
jgi:hypothetical protein